ncbi:MAG: hypothetical protein QXL35_00400 [Candidatus Bathyarchaeia archaeon]
MNAAGFSEPNSNGWGRDSRTAPLESGEPEDFEEIFRIVKKAVKAILGKERAGLMLVLADLPPNIGAFHSFGSNSIVLNRLALEAMRAEAKEEIEVKSYIFVVLLHEYLHSLGHLDEAQTRRLVYEISKELFGEGHPATRMAARGPLELLEGVMARGDMGERPPKIVKEFDPAYRGYIH